MSLLLNYQHIIDDELKKIKFPSNPANLYEPIEYSLNQGGKRIRPSLLLAACQKLGGDINKAINPAIGIEIFHNFTLLHDDIMDNAPIRRGNPTVFKKWNSNIAILSGDTMFGMASMYITATESKNLKDIYKTFNQTAIEICEGQQYDMDFENKSDVSIDDYLMMINLKTSVLIGASLKIGALIAETSEENCEKLYNYGKFLGIAFQLKDDLLDVYSNTQKFGKMKGGDILCGKKTFVYLKAIEILGIDKDNLRNIYMDKTLNDDYKIKTVIDIYNQLKMQNITQNYIEEYTKKAIEQIKSSTISEDTKKFFIGFVKELIDRES